MSLIRLTIVVIGLGLGIALVLSNPTTDDYLLFVEGQLGKAMDRSEQNQSTREQAMLKSIFRSHSHELMETAVRPHTLRRNMGVDEHLRNLRVRGAHRRAWRRWLLYST